MATTLLNPSREAIILSGVSWSTYEGLLADLMQKSAPRMAFDRGTLEIMSPTTEHEEYNRTIASLVEVVAEEKGIEFRSLGSTTYKRADMRRGFEPDSSFYIQSLPAIAGKTNIDMNIDPAPDLVIEIDITSGSLDKQPVFAEIGVPEVWRYDGTSFTILLLQGTDYREVETSRALPFLTQQVVSTFISESRSMTRLAWLKKLREWARNEAV
ncbi:MAG TPA: Uma2 family endonuclease [Blastocatellia bacterium]